MALVRSVGSKISTAFSSGGRKFKEYWINLFNDYKTVTTEAVVDLRSKPWKGAVAGSILAAIIYTVETNPDEHHFLATLVKHQSLLNLIGDPIRNPGSDDHVQSMLRLFNENRIGRLNFIFFSVIWRRDYAKECDLYAAQCKVLKPNWRDARDRFIDVGFCGKWILSDLAMRDYDVNSYEFFKNA